MSSNVLRVSIIVGCRNEAAHIRRFLESLYEQDMNGFEWEANIADGMSDDGTREILDEYCARDSRLHVIPNPDRIVSAGLNAAIRAACGEFILRLDAHTTYAPDYCRKCIEALLRTGADNAGGPARTRAGGACARAVAAAYHSWFSTGGGKFHDERFEGWVDTVPYGCWRRQTLEKIGLFDEQLVRNQDDELNLRLVRAGGKIWQSPDIVSWYSPRSSVAGLFRQYFQYGFWKVAVIRKHRIPASWRHLAPGSFLLVNLSLPATMAVAAAGHADAVLNACAALWSAVLASYGVTNLVASVGAARRHGWSILPYLPGIFATYHVSYGLGFVIGLLLAGSASNGRFANTPIFSGLTR